MSLRVTVFGMGYLGVTHAACLAELGHQVLGVDVDPDRIRALESGELPFFEPHLEELLQRNIDRRSIRFTSSYEEAANFSDVHFIGVGTPPKTDDPSADLTQLDAVIGTLAPLLTRPAILFGKSTVPVGTARRIAARLHDLAPAGIDVELSWNPEFLREGHAVADTMRPDRIVLGVARSRTGRAEFVAREIFAEQLSAGVPLIVTDLETAELVKVSANAFLATKISFINAVAEVCETTGADVTVLADAIGHDARIGRAFLDSGIGFGGGCLPKDVRAFMARAGELGADRMPALLREVDAINMRQRTQLVDMARDAVGGSLRGVRVAVLGAAFKPDSDDVRDSPALAIAAEIQREGAHVRVHDPKAMRNARKAFPALDYAPDEFEACRGAHAVLVLTEWRQFRELDPTALACVVDHPLVIDGRHCLAPGSWQAAGWTYRSIGRSPLRPGQQTMRTQEHPVVPLELTDPQ